MMQYFLSPPPEKSLLWVGRTAPANCDCWCTKWEHLFHEQRENRVLQIPCSAELFSGYYTGKKQWHFSTASQINSFHLKQCHLFLSEWVIYSYHSPPQGTSSSEEPTQANQDSVSIRTLSFTLKDWVPLLQPLYMVIPWKVHSAVPDCLTAYYEWSYRSRPFVFCLALLQKDFNQNLNIAFW